MNLKTDYKDEILKKGETHRTYNLVDDKGRIFVSGLHLEKAYVPFQEGDDFGAMDINTITKLLEHLPVANGGTGATNGNQALSNLGAKDHVVETGNNGGWAYTKYNNGLAIATVQKGFNHTSLSAWGSLYRTSELRIGALPFSFKSAPAIFASSTSWHGLWKISESGKTETDGGSIRMASATAHQDIYILLDIMVIGRWK